MDTIPNFEKLLKHLPPTEIYNESWLLRIVLNWCYENKEKIDELIPFDKESTWFSEAQLPTIFGSVTGKKLAEKQTHCDAIIGYIDDGYNGKGYLRLKHDCKQFTVIEAKMFSPLSKGVTNCEDYNQCSRTVACMAYLTSDYYKDYTVCFEAIDNISFILLLPDNKKEKHRESISKETVKTQVSKRVDMYKDTKLYSRMKGWHEKYFIPFLDKIVIQSISWKSIIEKINDENIRTFYDKCEKQENN